MYHLYGIPVSNSVGDDKAVVFEEDSIFEKV